MFGAYTSAQQARNRSDPAVLTVISLVQVVRGLRSSRPASAPMSLPELFACGSFAGGINSFCVTPVELVRNRLIMQFHRTSAPSAVSNAAPNAAPEAAAAAVRYSGPLDVVRQVVRAEGAAGMWRGLAPTLARDIPGVGMWYLAFEIAKRALTPSDGSPISALRLVSALPIYVRFLCGPASAFALKLRTS